MNCQFRVLDMPSDWTERHRPNSEMDLEGNEQVRNKIRQWLSLWKQGVPKKRGIFLVGPPGVGKTSIARAIAQDLGWSVIELNASDARNAVAIRKAATMSSTHRSLFHQPGDEKQKTLILLDEVDHLSGGLRKASETRVQSELQESRIESSSSTNDSGGKAELLHLLENTQQPVMLACNDEQRFWGRGNWRYAKDRFSKHLEIIKFKRVTKASLRRVAKKILREENITFTEHAVELLIDHNPGDLRALVRDLQVLCEHLDRELSYDDVEILVRSNIRDVSVELFPGLEALYKSTKCMEAIQLLRTIDKDESTFVDWVHWNNAQFFKKDNDIKRGNLALQGADRSLASRYKNTAHRSTYWSQHLTSLSASVANSTTFTQKLYPRYPSYLSNRFFSIRPHIIEQISRLSGTSNQTVVEEFLPLISTLYSSSHDLGNPQFFDVSLALQLTPEEHIALTDLPLSRNSSKLIMEEYQRIRDTIHISNVSEEIEQELNEEADSSLQSVTTDEPDENVPSGQMKLF